MSDDMFIFRGVNIYPGQIDEILSMVEGVSSEYNIILERQAGKDYMTINIERDPMGDPVWDDEIEDKISLIIKKEIMVSAEVRVVDYGTLPRSQKKSKRLFDKRSE